MAGSSGRKQIPLRAFQMPDVRKVLVLPGDGIGPEVTSQAVRVLEVVAEHDGSFALDYADFGGMAFDKHGSPLPEETLASALGADAVLLGAVGAPKYDQLASELRPEKALLKLRSALGVFANIRPVRSYPGLAKLRCITSGELRIEIFRELTGGIYFGEPRGVKGKGSGRYAFNTMAYTHAEIQRIARMAFAAASSRELPLCSVDKANVLEVSMLWREVVNEVGAEFPDVQLSHMYVDNAAMQLVGNPGQFGVILTSNLFGDILSDLASQITGSIGMLASASLGFDHGLYEPIHGSAPDIAGMNIANPCAAILSVSMLLTNSLKLPSHAAAVGDAVAEVIEKGKRTADIASAGEEALSCEQMGDAIIEELKLKLAAL